MKRSASTAALCAAAFAQAYLLVNVFPYAAYMSVFLLNGRASTTVGRVAVEDAGRYAALLASSFMVGRTVASVPWGVLADARGRRAALIASLACSGCASLWFGTATRYGGWAGAVAARGCMGAANAIVGVTKTVASELAFHDFDEEGDSSGGDGLAVSGEATAERTGLLSTQTRDSSNDEVLMSSDDKNRNFDDHRASCDTSREEMETKTVGLVMSMRAWGFLVAPAIAGYLADPYGVRNRLDHQATDVYANENVQEYDGHGMRKGGNLVQNVLKAYPYLLPNFLGAILCWVSALAVYLGIPETLPQCRSGSLIINDLCNNLREGTRVLHRKVCCMGRKASIFVSAGIRQPNDNQDSQIGAACEDASDRCSGHYGSIGDSESTRHHLVDSHIQQKSTANLSSIWSRCNTRQHLISYWFYSMIIIAIDEAFPLYCISRGNGLRGSSPGGGGGLSELQIGQVLSVSGLIFSAAQYRVYSECAGVLSCSISSPFLNHPSFFLCLPSTVFIVNNYGVYGSLRFGCWWGVLPVALMPLASLLSNIHHGSMAYLSLLVGITKIFQSAFFSSITVATNRTVPRDMRSSMNGVGGTGAGVAKAVGPILAGYWMAYCLSWDARNVDSGGANSNDMIQHLNVPYGSLVGFAGISSLGLIMLRMLSKLQHEA